LKSVTNLLSKSKLDEDGAALPKIKAAQSAVESAGVTHNPHTLLTLRDCEVQFQQYQAFLQRKQKALEEEIQHKKMRGVTQQEYDDIQRQFEQFDKDKSQKLDRNEFKACLFSLGYEYDAQQVTKVMRHHGAQGTDDKKLQITKEQFRDFMISLLGDTDTKEEIVKGFRLINRGANHATRANLEQVLANDAVDYIMSQAPPKAGTTGGADYEGLTNALFLR